MLPPPKGLPWPLDFRWRPTPLSYMPGGMHAVLCCPVSAALSASVQRARQHSFIGRPTSGGVCKGLATLVQLQTTLKSHSAPVFLLGWAEAVTGPALQDDFSLRPLLVASPSIYECWSPGPTLGNILHAKFCLCVSFSIPEKCYVLFSI